MKQEEGKKQRCKKEKGDILVSALVFAAVAITVITSLVNWGASMLSNIRAAAAKEEAFQIAEAGIDYYRWHLAQYPTDYEDGTNGPGPYNHDFYDKNGNIIGGYSLSITPPPNGSTEVTITSTGTTTMNSSVKRVIQAVLAEPSLAQYAVVANDYMRFGAGTIVNGPVTSNQGIHFDTGAVANNIVSSAVATETDPDSGNVEWGVWTDADPAYSTNTPAPTSTQGVFMAGRQYPVPATDFNGLLSNLNTLQTLSETNGVCVYKGGSCWPPSGGQGYYMSLNGNGTYTIYTVNSQLSVSRNCSSGMTSYYPGWNSWSIGVNRQGSPDETLIGTYSIPTNGVIFVEDNLWVDGSATSSRVTIAAGFGNNGLVPNIVVNNNLTYPLDGSSMVGLIAQGSVLIGLASADSYTIDGALVAENGNVGRYYYNSACGSTYARTSVTLNGMIITNKRYGFAWTGYNAYDCGGSIGWIASGYCTRDLNYDGNLLYAPPPDFPLASTQYELVSWRELQ